MAENGDRMERLRAMKLRLWQQLSAIEGVRVNGPMPDEAESSHVHAYPTWLPRHQFRHRHELSRG